MTVRIVDQKGEHFVGESVHFDSGLDIDFLRTNSSQAPFTSVSDIASLTCSLVPIDDALALTLPPLTPMSFRTASNPKPDFDLSFYHENGIQLAIGRDD